MKWTEKEEKQILIDKNTMSTAELAEKYKRTERAIKSKITVLEKQGITPKTETKKKTTTKTKPTTKKTTTKSKPSAKKKTTTKTEKTLTEAEKLEEMMNNPETMNKDNLQVEDEEVIEGKVRKVGTKTSEDKVENKEPISEKGFFDNVMVEINALFSKDFTSMFENEKTETETEKTKKKTEELKTLKEQIEELQKDTSVLVKDSQEKMKEVFNDVTHSETVKSIVDITEKGFDDMVEFLSSLQKEIEAYPLKKAQTMGEAKEELRKKAEEAKKKFSKEKESIEKTADEVKEQFKRDHEKEWDELKNSASMVGKSTKTFAKALATFLFK